MTNTAPPRVDPVLSAACAWIRSRGLRNHQFSVLPALGHYHVKDCRFDMNVLIAVAFPGVGRTVDIQTVPDAPCPVCAEQDRIGLGGLRWLEYVRNGISWQAHDHLGPTRLLQIGEKLKELADHGSRITDVHLFDQDARDMPVPEGFPVTVTRVGYYD